MKLNEKLITFNNKAYPENGNIVLLAGTPGSGKSFIRQHLLGIHGKIIDPDEHKEMILKNNTWKKLLFDRLIKKNIIKRIDDKYYSINNIKFELDEPDLFNKLIPFYQIGDEMHELEKEIGITNLRLNTLKKSSIKPNIIFDFSLRSEEHLKMTKQFVEIGYDKKNIHIVYVCNELRVAWEQNLSRLRNMSLESFMRIHTQSAEHIEKIILNSEYIRQYADGDIWIVFSKADTDTVFINNTIIKSNFIKIKNSGEDIKTPEQVIRELTRSDKNIGNYIQKFKDYTDTKKFLK